MQPRVRSLAQVFGAVGLAALVAACSSSDNKSTGAPDAASGQDATAPADAATGLDAAAPGTDAGAGRDASGGIDATSIDSGVPDGGGPGDAGTSGGDAGCLIDSTFTSLYTSVLNSPAECNVAGCHASPGQYGLFYSDSKANVYARIVGVDSGEDPAFKRVSPGQPANSYLYLKLSMANPPAGARMPYGGQPLPQCALDAIRTWITNGAPNN